MTEHADYRDEAEDYAARCPAEPETGDDITGAEGALVISIPAAKYPAGKTATAQDADLSAGNIKDGVDIFGVVGTFAGAAGVAIESMQYGTVAVSSGNSTGTATITSVDTSNALVVYLGGYGTDNLNKDALFSVVLTDATTVTARRAATGGTGTVGFVVIEFTGAGIASIQKGEISITDPAYSNTATITTVDTSKAVIIPGGCHHSYTAALLIGVAYLTLTNATTVTATRGHSIATATIPFTVIEFAD